MTLSELLKNGYEIKHNAYYRGYVSRKQHYGDCEAYVYNSPKRKYKDCEYCVLLPNWKSTRYCLIYYLGQKGGNKKI